MKKVIFPMCLVLVLAVSSGVVFGQKALRPAPKTVRPEAALKFNNVVAVSDGDGVFLRWSTEGERGVIGFYVYRNGENGSELVESEIIPGGYLRTRLADNYIGDYTFFDPNGGLSNSYIVETVELNGKRTRYGKITPQVVPDIAPIAGRSEAELRETIGKRRSVELRENLVPGDLQKQFSENIFPPDLPTQRWVASQPGVKIVTKQNGLYRVTRAQLQNAGFDVNSQGGNWQLFLEGREQAITVGAGDSFIEFYGVGMDTLESDTQTYYLIVGASGGKRMGTRVMRPISSPVASSGFGQTLTRRERASYFNGILNGDAENFFSAQLVGNTSALSYSLPISAIDYSVLRSTVRISLQGLTVNPHNVEITINGQLMPSTISFNGQDAGNGQFEIDTALLVQGTNTIQMKGLAGVNDYSVINTVAVDYSRRFEADQNQLSFYTANYRTSRLTGFASANVRVFDLTAPDSPDAVLGLSVVGNGPTFDVAIPSNRGRVLYAVEESAVRAPLSVVQNFPSQLASPSGSADMIIVTHRDWMAEAQNWATYRASSGLNVVVVDVADIFDEFSYGAQSSSAMTEFFQYAEDNWATAPQYIMLLGDATYDPKNYGNAAFNSYVPTKLVETLYEETGSDEALCDFNNDGLSEISVGRIPARSSADVALMLAKVTQFEGSVTNAYNRGALFVSDLPIGYDFEGVNNRVSQQLPPSWPKNFIPRSDPNARNLLLADLNLGRYLVNYSGHGSTIFWAASNFYHRNDIPLLTNQNNLTIFTLLTCLNGYFTAPGFDSFAETAIRAPNGGAVVAWASSGKTTPDIQEIMATRFYDKIGGGTIPRVGDLVKDAKQSLVGGRDVRLSWTLFGDPAMRVR
ncbi:MAG: hypothetical protein IPJ30_25435 [Acidobacteria bacterium]|nr:hypothetical protein [Acidobacteriota bacterium]